MWRVLGFLVFVSLVVPGSMQPQGPPEGVPPGIIPETTTELEGVAGRLQRLPTKTTTKKKIKRTKPPTVSFPENCEYQAYYCLKAYITGKVCARTQTYLYHTFKNYCMLDYVNCMERFDMWESVYMGECIKLKTLYNYAHYPTYDRFLEQYYIVEDI